MKISATIMCVVFTLGLAGCGGNSSASKPVAPLSVTDWKMLPSDEKYTPETLERLHEGDPSLQTPEGWETFQKTVIGPSRKKDFPKGKAR